MTSRALQTLRRCERGPPGRSSIVGFGQESLELTGEVGSLCDVRRHDQDVVDPGVVASRADSATRGTLGIPSSSTASSSTASSSPRRSPSGRTRPPSHTAASSTPCSRASTPGSSRCAPDVAPGLLPGHVEAPSQLNPTLNPIRTSLPSLLSHPRQNYRLLPSYVQCRR